MVLCFRISRLCFRISRLCGGGGIGDFGNFGGGFGDFGNLISWRAVRIRLVDLSPVYLEWDGGGKRTATRAGKATRTGINIVTV